MQSKIIKVTVLALSLGMLGGCADMAQVEKAQATADAAMSKANEAYKLAQKVHSIASDASYSAKQAQETADEALACCNANSEKLDRMFEKAMAK